MSTGRRPAGELLDVRGTTEYLGAPTESSVRHMIERGHLPALRLGGRVYVRRETLDRFLERREREFAKARGASA